MSAAWLLSRRHRVTLYEAENRLGGHSHTVDVAGTPVDTGFIVYNEPNYPNLSALFRHLGVETAASAMGFSVSLDGGALEYAGSLPGLLAQPSALFRRDYWRMLCDTARFYREAPRMLAGNCRQSLGEYLAANRYSEAFARLHLLPMGAAIWSSSIADMMAHPAEAFARFFVNHGLFQFAGRPQWRTVKGGSAQYVKKLTQGFAKDVRLGAGVKTILRGRRRRHHRGRQRRPFRLRRRRRGGARGQGARHAGRSDAGRARAAGRLPLPAPTRSCCTAMRR